MAERNEDVGSSLMDSLSCKICLEVLNDPVQCQNNEHYFCRGCITRYLSNCKTCPCCKERLTLKALRPAPRIVLEIMSQITKLARSCNVVRGCTENINVEELLLHERLCLFASAACLNKECEEPVNRRDKESQETNASKFRELTCKSSVDEMSVADNDRHQCSLRTETNEMKSRLNEMSEALKQITATQNEVLQKLELYGQSIKDLQDPLRRASSTIIRREETTVVNGQIFIFGGTYGAATVEVFNWSTRAWTLVKDSLFFSRNCSFSFLYGNKMMICGGTSTERIEYLSPGEKGYTSTVSQVSLPEGGQHNGLLFDNRILTFNNGVYEIVLESPEKSRVLLHEEKGRLKTASVQRFGKNVYIVGGEPSKMEEYDVAKNELQTLPSLPHESQVTEMATVAYKDNIIILGGKNGYNALDDVLMFNVFTYEYKKLPSMLEKRAGCTAVIMGDVIVVMGGRFWKHNDVWQTLNTVEYYVIGENAWKQLPTMNQARSFATACVYV